VISDQIEVDTWPAGHFAVIGPFTHDRKAYALPRAATDLLHRVDEWLAAREADGWLNEERRRWFGAQATVTAEQASLEALVMAVDLRLQLMPLVAAIKRRDHLPIQDPAQEARVLERARGSATAADLDPNDVAALFQVLIDAAKVVERQAADAPVPEGMQLEDVRAAVATCSDQLIRELARGQPWLRGSDTHDRLDATIRTGLTVPGLTPALVARLVDALGSVRQATSGGALK
jgi:chorismate mutase-like protein